MRTLIIIHYLFKFSPLVEMTMMTILAHESSPYQVVQVFKIIAIMPKQ